MLNNKAIRVLRKKLMNYYIQNSDFTNPINEHIEHEAQEYADRVIGKYIKNQ